MPPKGNGSFAKGGNQNPMGRAPRTDPGGNAYQYSDLALKTNEVYLPKNMPLIREFPRNLDWETDAKRWAMMLYNHPVSMGGGA